MLARVFHHDFELVFMIFCVSLYFVLQHFFLPHFCFSLFSRKLGPVAEKKRARRKLLAKEKRKKREDEDEGKDDLRLEKCFIILKETSELARYFLKVLSCSRN